MNTLTYCIRTTFLIAVGLIAIGALLSPQSVRAQEVVFTTSGFSGTATGTNALAGGTGSNANGSGATAYGSNAAAIGNASTALGFGATTTTTGTAVGGSFTGFGAGPTVTGTNGVALGNGSFLNGPAASGETAIAIGSALGPSGPGPVASGANAIAIGGAKFAGGALNGAVASGAQSVAIGTGSSASGTNAIAFGTSASAGFANSAAIGNGATTTRANQMSFGTSSNTYTMAGVTSAASTAAQSGPTQFVTTDLNGNLASFNLQPVLGRLRNRIENTRSEEQGGIALAIATANLRYDDRPGKMSVAGGLGGFQHEAGGSLGLGYTAPNQRVRFNVSAGGSTHGDFGGGGGLSLTLN